MSVHEHMQPGPEEIVAGKYRLTRLIGRGGMGTVWEGIHLTLGTRVAVKFIDGAVAESPEALRRFENEARAAARLNSKYAVQVYDHGTNHDGRPFIVMEYLTGEPLDARLDRETRIAPAETARIISQVCRALSRAHAAGIVHRDLKPENIFLVWDDEDQANVAKVVDFGIAKFTTSQIGVSSSTRTGSLLGTPYFMSPEQARGLRSVDHRSDLWSLGVIAYRCVVGRLPFEGVSVGDLLVKICTAPIPIPSQECGDCPAGFDTWFARAMQREPADRFASAQELSDQLLAVCGGGRASLTSGILGGLVEAGAATPNPVVPGVTTLGTPDVTGDVFARTAQISARNKASLSIAGAVALVTLVLGGWALLHRQSGPEVITNEPNASAARPVAASFGLPVPTVAPAASSVVAPSLQPVEPSTAPSIALDVAKPSAPLPGPVAPTAHGVSRATTASGGAKPAHQPGAAPSGRGAHPRPVDNRPIDVGY